MAKLKVFRTPAGFHDAYVAAPSQKAALAAWGSSANLFARGLAEEVTDPALSAAPLERPGEIIRVARTMADAPPPSPVRQPRPAKPKARASAAEAQPSPTAIPERPSTRRHKGTLPPKRKPAPKPPSKPKPSRAALDKAEAAIEAAEARQAKARAALKREEEALIARRRALDQAHDVERTKLDDARRRAYAKYQAALEDWRQQ